MSNEILRFEIPEDGIAVLTMNRLRLGRAVVALLSVHRSGSARARQEERRRHERRRNDRKS